MLPPKHRFREGKVVELVVERRDHLSLGSLLVVEYLQEEKHDTIQGQVNLRFARGLREDFVKSNPLMEFVHGQRMKDSGSGGVICKSWPCS